MLAERDRSDEGATEHATATAPGSPGLHSTACKRAAAVFCVALTAATLAPVLENWRERPADGFPFSYYPMFSRPVGKTYRVTHAVGIAGDGREHVIPFRYLGSGGMNEVRNRVQRAAREDPHGFCSEVAAALRAHAADELGGIREVVVVTGAYLMQAFYEGRIEARSKREHARCRVAR